MSGAWTAAASTLAQATIGNAYRHAMNTQRTWMLLPPHPGGFARFYITADVSLC